MGGFLDNLALGLQVAFTGANLAYCFLGVFIGTLIGVLPGIGPVGTISLLLPITFGINPASAIILLAGIYYGAQFGGSTTSILVNIPGEASSVVTCLDGYQMARRGQAGPALGMAAFGSFIAGTIAVIIVMFLSQPLSAIALKFGPPEYFALMVLVLTILVYLSQGSVLKAVIMGALGICLSLMGMDIVTGHLRYTFGFAELEDGVGLIPVVMGLFGVSEVLVNLQESQDFEIFKGKVKGILPTARDWSHSMGAIVRGTVVGFFLGILPGGGAIIASFMSYAIEKKISKTPERFGKGAIEGVAGPESANNAASGGAFIPLFSLGIPANAIMALLLGALMIHGVQPGPMLINEHPDIFWGTIMSMYFGNAMLLVLNLPLIGFWIKLLKTPYWILAPLILFFCAIGSYSINNSVFDILSMTFFGIVGYFFKRFKYEPAPLIMAFILGPMLEKSLRQSFLMSRGDYTIFFTRSISASCLILSVVILLFAVFLKRYRRLIPL